MNFMRPFIVLVLLFPFSYSQGQDTISYFHRIAQNRVLNTCNEDFEKIEVTQEATLDNPGELYRKIVGTRLWKLCDDAGIEGYAKIQFLIDKNGEYICHRVIDEEWIFISLCYTEHIAWMKFKPAILDSLPVKNWTDTLALKITGGIN